MAEGRKRLTIDDNNQSASSGRKRLTNDDEILSTGESTKSVQERVDNDTTATNFINKSNNFIKDLPENIDAAALGAADAMSFGLLQYNDNFRGKINEAKKNSPWSAGIGEIGGSLIGGKGITNIAKNSFNTGKIGAGTANIISRATNPNTPIGMGLNQGITQGIYGGVSADANNNNNVAEQVIFSAGAGAAGGLAAPLVTATINKGILPGLGLIDNSIKNTTRQIDANIINKQPENFATMGDNLNSAKNFILSKIEGKPVKTKTAEADVIDNSTIKPGFKDTPGFDAPNYPRALDFEPAEAQKVFEYYAKHGTPEQKKKVADVANKFNAVKEQELKDLEYFNNLSNVRFRNETDRIIDKYNQKQGKLSQKEQEIAKIWVDAGSPTFLSKDLIKAKYEAKKVHVDNINHKQKSKTDEALDVIQFIPGKPSIFASSLRHVKDGYMDNKSYKHLLDKYTDESVPKEVLKTINRDLDPNSKIYDLNNTNQFSAENFLSKIISGFNRTALVNPKDRNEKK